MTQRSRQEHGFDVGRAVVSVADEIGEAETLLPVAATDALIDRRSKAAVHSHPTLRINPHIRVGKFGPLSEQSTARRVS
jgi:hypothetical protein